VKDKASARHLRVLIADVVPEKRVNLKIEHQHRRKNDEFFTILKFLFDE